MIMRISMPNRFRLKKVMGFRTMIRPERGEIHYIGGADILPAPLSLKEETEALNKFGTEEEKEAKSELIEHNLRLVVYIANWRLMRPGASRMRSSCISGEPAR